MTIEEQLHKITLRIEKSPISDVRKQEFYKTIRTALLESVEPLLVKYLPEAQLKFLTSHPEKLSPDSYISLIQNTLKNSEALKEMNELMLEVLNIFEKNLPVEIT